MKEILIYGSGSFANLMKYYFEKDGLHKVISYVLDEKYINSTSLDGVPIVSFESVDKIYPPSTYEMFVAIGYSEMRNRVLMYEKAKNKNYKLCNYISKNAVIDDSVVMGENNVIFQGVQIEPFAKLGSNNIIWSSVNILHDVIIGHHNLIAAKSTIGGFSCIENNCFLAFNSTILHKITISDESLIGACSLVNKNTRKFSKNIGVPAKEISSHAESGIKIT